MEDQQTTPKREQANREPTRALYPFVWHIANASYSSVFSVIGIRNHDLFTRTWAQFSISLHPPCGRFPNTVRSPSARGSLCTIGESSSRLHAPKVGTTVENTVHMTVRSETGLLGRLKPSGCSRVGIRQRKISAQIPKGYLWAYGLTGKPNIPNAVVPVSTQAIVKSGRMTL